MEIWKGTIVRALQYMLSGILFEGRLIKVKDLYCKL